jgi:hypothetical protein
VPVASAEGAAPSELSGEPNPSDASNLLYCWDEIFFCHPIACVENARGYVHVNISRPLCRNARQSRHKGHFRGANRCSWYLAMSNRRWRDRRRLLD